MATMRYPLEVLVKTRNWELDAVRQKVLAARDAVSENEKAVDRLQSEISQAEAEFVREGGRARILIERRKLVALFVKERRKQLEERRERLNVDRDGLAKLTGEMTLLRRSILALERHRERHLKTFNARVEKNIEKAQDEAWLGRRRVQGRG
jgi:DNA repair exonuclease SbcCD ATPase subunit